MTNSKSTKRAMLTSALSVLACVAMLIGTTFAWFTDTASTGVNKIQAGNLDVALEMKEGDKWVTAEGKTLNFKTADNRTTDILWEPGCTYELPELRVVNNGNLALKYKIQITGINGDAELNDVIDWTINNAAINLTEQHLVAKAEGEAFTIKGHMKETAGNEYQGLSIDGISITVVATQDTVENDSYNNEYDKNATYPDVVTVTPDTFATTQFQSNTTYYFAAGDYGVHGESANQLVFYELQNVTLVGLPGAKFTSLNINSIDYVDDVHNNPVNNDKSTLIVKGFEVTGDLMIVAADKSVVVEDNKAAQITVKTNVSTKDIAVNNNTLTGGENGVYIVPNISDYNLTVTGNTFNGIQSHAIHVQGCGDGSAVTAANSITVTGNTFTSYGTNGKAGRAAFKIWADTKLAPNGTDPLNNAAKDLAKVINEKNTFASNLNNNCVVADFYGKAVAFN